VLLVGTVLAFFIKPERPFVPERRLAQVA
jgi:hypothetical protein